MNTKSTKGNKSKAVTKPIEIMNRSLLADVRQMILQAREGVARAIDSSLTMLHWHVGRRIREDILKEKRAEYGGEIVATLGRQLESEFGRGFGRRNLFHMIRFAEVFPNLKIVQSLMTQLSWTHFLYLIALDDPLKRDFYAEMCRIERWNTRTLNNKIQSMLFERTALSRKPGEESPLGLILCAGKRRETVELLDLERSGIQVSSYWTEILPKGVLERKLHEAVILARARLETRKE